ncbi:MAG: S9 family peptidase [Thermoproteota archaeon]|nr:S9 family peptidase [Candidatus Brockarchaeota archaeon]
MEKREVSNLEWNEKTFSLFSYLNSIRITKNGKRISYVLTKTNLPANKYENTIVIEELEDGERKFVENATMPRFSPDGEKMTFLRTVEGEAKKIELWLLNIKSMSMKKLLESDNLNEVVWNEDNRRILLTKFKKNDDTDFFFEDNAPVWFNEKGFISKEETLIQVYDTESEEVLETLKEKFFMLPYFPVAVWHKNSVVFNVPNRKNPYSLFNIYSYEDGKKEKLFENVSFRAINSNDSLLLLHGKPKKNVHAEHNYLYLYDGKTVRPVTENLAYDNLFGKIGKDGSVYFTSSKKGKVTLEAIKGNKVVQIVDENASVTDFDISDDEKVVLLKQSDVELNEAYLFENGKLKKLTAYNELILQKLKVKRHNHFKYNSVDGLEIDGWFIKPEIKDNEKAPLVVFVHGGPKGMYGYAFDFMAQLLASKGFFVLFTNPRGSSGYDEQFALRVIKRTGLEDFQDILEGIEWLLENESQVDKDKIGITGISYGGFMTNWAITQKPSLFKAAVSENGISYWLTSYAFSDIGLWFDKELIGENPLEDENFYKLSPIFYARNVTTPTLIIHSLEDYRCPLDQSVMFYHVLKDLEKEAYLIVFKKGDHGHSIRGLPKHRSKRYKIITEFFISKLIKEEKEFNIEDLIKKD